jgi:hypothetical protein
MNRRLNVAPSFAASLFDGVLSHYIMAKAVLTQSPVVPLKEVSAQTFILANDKGVPYGRYQPLHLCAPVLNPASTHLGAAQTCFPRNNCSRSVSFKVSPGLSSDSTGS